MPCHVQCSQNGFDDPLVHTQTPDIGKGGREGGQRVRSRKGEGGASKGEAVQRRGGNNAIIDGSDLRTWISKTVEWVYVVWG